MSNNDQVLLPDRYQVVPRTLIFLFSETRVLLLKGSPQKRIWANRYNGIGGHIERGEDVLSAARRELFEESGLEADDLMLCGVIMIDTGKQAGIALFVFKGNHIRGDVRASTEGNLEWVETTAIDELPVVEDLRVLLPRVINMRPGETPFSAIYSYSSDNRLMINFG
ncbi:MAG TPA: NUDIX domain-containing protein [Anaerolineaceae bacterium]